MFDIQNRVQSHSYDQPALSDLRHFVDLYTGALYDAAALLAGARGVLIVDQIVEGMSEPDGPTSRTITALNNLRDILTLENVDDLTRPEAHFFMSIDPAEPIVEEICLLTDQLEAIMSDLATACELQSSDGRAAA
jgi:hypothetical protein